MAEAVVTSETGEITGEPTVRPEDIVLPPPSYWPILLAFGFACITAGLALSLAISVVGLVIVLVATIGWVIEPGHGGEVHG